MDIDIDNIRHLVELMVANDLSRIELREGESLLLLRRGQPVMTAPAVAAVAPAMGLATPVTANSPAVPPSAVTAPPTVSSPEPSEVVIRSPMVGTFYAAADPESPPFAKVGDMVGPDTVVCLVEAMKVYNEIKAEVSGRIAKVLVKNAEAVEFDQPLFIVTP